MSWVWGLGQVFMHIIITLVYFFEKKNKKEMLRLTELTSHLVYVCTFFLSFSMPVQTQNIYISSKERKLFFECCYIHTYILFYNFWVLKREKEKKEKEKERHISGLLQRGFRFPTARHCYFYEQYSIVSIKRQDLVSSSTFWLFY